MTAERQVSPDSAQARLREGNARFGSDRPQPWQAGKERRMELAAAGAHPLACIITCSDARVSPEILFDQSLGDLFVVRLAGNVVSPEAVASVEFAVELFRVPLVVVLGHSECAAIRTALNGSPQTSGFVNTLFARIAPALSAARSKRLAGEDLFDAAIHENARIGAEELVNCSSVITDLVHTGRVQVLSAIYDLRSGVVQFDGAAASAGAP